LRRVLACDDFRALRHRRIVAAASSANLRA
jgi:hypothetical protein